MTMKILCRPNLNGHVGQIEGKNWLQDSASLIQNEYKIQICNINTNKKYINNTNTKFKNIQI